MGRGLMVALCMTFLLATAGVSADVVFHMTDPCPPGSEEQTDHCGPWCQPSQCSAEDDCQPLQDPKTGKPRPRTCRNTGLCVEDDTYDSCSGWSRGKPLERKIARGPCTSDSDCTRPATCRSAKRCVPGAAAIGSSKTAAKPAEPHDGSDTADRAGTTEPKSRCGCGLIGLDRHKASWALLTVWVLVLAMTHRRRRR